MVGGGWIPTPQIRLWMALLWWSSLVWKRYPPNHVFSSGKIWKSLGAKFITMLVARLHIADATIRLLRQFQWDIIDYSPYSPDLAPSEFHLFPELKMWLGRQRFLSNKDLYDNVNAHLISLAKIFLKKKTLKNLSSDTINI